MMLHDLPKTIDNGKRRVGRGRASGKGKTSGRGMNGQRSRAHVRPGFEGGQTRLIKRLRQLRGRSFSARDNKIGIVNLSQLDKAYSSGDQVTVKSLIEKGLIRKESRSAKVLGRGNTDKTLSFAENIVLSHKAKEKLGFKAE
jgi:large subunit ribosomal protein L15